MNNYEKPMILMNEEIAEGVYAASGDTGSSGPSVVKGTEEYGQNHFTVSVDSAYQGKHIIITLLANKELSGGWTDASFTYSGFTFTLESWTSPASFAVTLLTSDSSSIEVVSSAIKVV